MSSIFNRYITLKVNYEITVKNPNNFPLTATLILLGNETTNSQSLQFLMEQPKNRTFTVDNAGGRNVRTIYGSIDK